MEGGHSKTVAVAAVGVGLYSLSVILGDESSRAEGEAHSMREPWEAKEEGRKVWMLAGLSPSPVVEGEQDHGWEVVEVRCAGPKMVGEHQIFVMAVLNPPWASLEVVEEAVARQPMVPPGGDLNVHIFQRPRLVEEPRSEALRTAAVSRAEVVAPGGQHLRSFRISSGLGEEGGQLLVWVLGEPLEEVVVEGPWHPRGTRSQGEGVGEELELELVACSSRPALA